MGLDGRMEGAWLGANKLFFSWLFLALYTITTAAYATVQQTMLDLERQRGHWRRRPRAL